MCRGRLGCSFLEVSEVDYRLCSLEEGGQYRTLPSLLRPEYTRVNRVEF